MTGMENNAGYWLGELLAVIHRDGGHYQSQHGTEKAVRDAIDTVNQLRIKLDNAGWREMHGPVHCP